ncbi:MAG: polysaccharide deacetylase family protein [Vicinamibacteraceae bacterium]
MSLNAFTVDLEEWFHICGVEGPLAAANWANLPSRVELTTRRLLGELDGAGVRATFFILGWVAARYPALVGEIAAAGHEIGSHGYWHRWVHLQTPEQLTADLEAGRAALEAAGIHRVTAYRAPEWSINDRSRWALECLARCGFDVDASMAPVAIVGRASYPRRPHVRATWAGPIVEAPPLVIDRFGQAMPIGWGWGLRMSAPRRVLAAIEQTNRAGDPAVLMVHPWEIDHDPPRVSLPARQRFAHYFRLEGFLDRLRVILRGASFQPLGEVLASDVGVDPAARANRR